MILTIRKSDNTTWYLNLEKVNAFKVNESEEKMTIYLDGVNLDVEGYDCVRIMGWLRTRSNL